jgi:hypothetical protein
MKSQTIGLLWRNLRCRGKDAGLNKDVLVEKKKKKTIT